MSNKKKDTRSGLVYSTDPNWQAQTEDDEEVETLDNAAQKLQVVLDTKQRAGKIVTIIKGFIGKSDDLAKLEKKLKSFCGTGGSSKDGLIIIQGDNKSKIVQFLNKENYQVK
ncbi:MAG: translation initiation factor [Chitinophagaceae bacterium]